MRYRTVTLVVLLTLGGCTHPPPSRPSSRDARPSCQEQYRECVRGKFGNPGPSISVPNLGLLDWLVVPVAAVAWAAQTADRSECRKARRICRAEGGPMPEIDPGPRPAYTRIGGESSRRSVDFAPSAEGLLDALPVEDRDAVETEIRRLRYLGHDYDTVATDPSGEERLGRFVEGTDWVILYGLSPETVIVHGVTRWTTDASP